MFRPLVAVVILANVLIAVHSQATEETNLDDLISLIIANDTSTQPTVPVSVTPAGAQTNRVSIFVVNRKGIQIQVISFFSRLVLQRPRCVFPFTSALMVFYREMN